MDILQLQQKTVAILGLGQEGQAIARYLIKHQIKFTIFDQRTEDQLNQIGNLNLPTEQASFSLGQNYLSKLKDFEIIFRSPGISLTKIQEYINPQAQILSQTKYFFANCPAKIVGITGTKGKGTTSALIYNLLKTKYNCYLTGNIGKDQPLDFLEELTSDDFVIYEMSSFQLQDLEQSPHIGVCLMVTSDHLDYHQDLHEYHTAKESICKFQTPKDYVIFNQDYPASVEIGQSGDGQKLTFSTQAKDFAELMSSNGSFVIDEQLFIKLNRQELQINITDRKIVGVHNKQNISAAILTALILEIKPEQILEVLAQYRGLPYRLEPVAQIGQSKFINDGVSTSPDSAIAAIKAFPHNSILAIVGGYDKGLDFSHLVDELNTNNNVKAVITLGQTGALIAPQLDKNKLQHFGQFTNLAKAFDKITTLNQDFDVVLFSPGFASFDMFKNTYDRSEQFSTLVKEYAKQK
ncbi:MAG: UDP-N-acetylmuramoyl-L-alanine--D-glutamate ligase [Candidatus Doudnabacteria bacterium]